MHFCRKRLLQILALGMACRLASRSTWSIDVRSAIQESVSECGKADGGMMYAYRECHVRTGPRAVAAYGCQVLDGYPPGEMASVFDIAASDRLGRESHYRFD